MARENDKPPYSFFWSYASADWDPFMEPFLNDIEAELRVRGNGRGFLDHRDSRTGTAWRLELIDGLRQSHSLVALLGPNYFASEYCIKEWNLFGQFPDAWSARLPLLWVSCDDMPEPWKSLNYARRGVDKGIPEQGLRWLCKNKNDPALQKQYHACVDAIALDILTQVGAKRALPEFVDQHDLDAAAANLESAIKRNGMSIPKGPDHVYWLYVVARADDATLKKKAKTGYPSDLSMEWIPFVYDGGTEKIWQITTKCSASTGIFGHQDNWPIDAKLPPLIQQAVDRNCLVVLVVDPWTAESAPFQDVLRLFDKKVNAPNTSVIIPWCLSDKETEQRFQELERTIKETFPNRLDRRSDVYFRHRIQSEKQLSKHLKEVLTRLQAEAFKSQPRSGLPAPGSKPIVSAASENARL